MEHGKDAAAPDVPAKEGCYAAWDRDGKAITSDTEINAVYTAIPETDSPQTGDHGYMALWALLLSAIGGAVVVLTSFGRKQQAQ